jgi:histidinol-phosphate aminotransferase
MSVPDSQGNFVWFAAGERTGDLAAAADDLGIVVRPFAGDGARISIGETEANDRIIELAQTFPLHG